MDLVFLNIRVGLFHRYSIAVTMVHTRPLQ
jgi:hypothetical protein